MWSLLQTQVKKQNEIDYITMQSKWIPDKNNNCTLQKHQTVKSLLEMIEPYYLNDWKTTKILGNVWVRKV